MWQQTKPAVATFAFHIFDFGCQTAACVAVTKWNRHNSGTKLIGVFVLHVSHFSFMLIACLCFMLIFFQCTYWMLLYNFHLCLFHVCARGCVRTRAFLCWTFTFSDRNKHPLCKTPLFWSKITVICVVTATRKLVNEQRVTRWLFSSKRWAFETFVPGAYARIAASSVAKCLVPLLPVRWRLFKGPIIN